VLALQREQRGEEVAVVRLVRNRKILLKRTPGKQNRRNVRKLCAIGLWKIQQTKKTKDTLVAVRNLVTLLVCQILT
jgi:hypothetical protein